MERFPALDSSWKLTSNSAVRDFLKQKKEGKKVLPLLEKYNQQYLSNILLHLHLLRSYEPRPLYPYQIHKTLIEESVNPQLIHNFIGPNKEKEVQGLAPQAVMGMRAYNHIVQYYKENEKYNMAHLLLITTNTGAGKSGFDWTLYFLLRDGMLYWPDYRKKKNCANLARYFTYYISCFPK